jgi:hypothetical protein
MPHQIWKGALTFKKDGRQSVKIQLKDNPFKKADAALSANELEDLAITIANPPLAEVIIVARSTVERDLLYRVLRRFCFERKASTLEEGEGS